MEGIASGNEDETDKLLNNENYNERAELFAKKDYQVDKDIDDDDGTMKKMDRYQLEISLIILIFLHLLDKFQMFHPHTTKFLTLQYENSDSNTYDIGINDTFFVIYWIFIATFIRAFIMNLLLRPLAMNILPIKGVKNVQRFKEQGWYTLYYTTSFSIGAYIYLNSKAYGNLNNLYTDWPLNRLSPLFKTYYLAELACWLQQVFILNIEARRKDHYQMFSHHIITCWLIALSYYYYFARIGNVILIMMDFVDIIFALAKVTKYCGYQRLCDFLFLVFVLSWIVLRHGLFNVILYHVATKLHILLEGQKCIPGVVSDQRCITDGILNVFVALLGGLQIITIIWMYLIIKVVIKVLSGNGADDVRSDEEGGSDDDDE